MMEITAEIRALIDKAAAGVELAGDEYIDPADGLIHCKRCGGQRQTVVPCFGKPGYFMPRCICQCQREAEEQRKAAEERQRRMETVERCVRGLQRPLSVRLHLCQRQRPKSADGQGPRLCGELEGGIQKQHRPACCSEMWELASPFSPVVSPTPCLTGMCRC